MKIKINPIEKKQERQRIKISVLFSIGFHVIFFIIFLFLSKFTQEQEKVVVIKVRLTDKIKEEIDRMSEKERQKLKKQQKKARKKIKKQLEKKKKDIEKKINKEKQKIETREKEIKTINEEADLFEEYQKIKEEEKKKEEEEFFIDENISEDSEKDESFELEDELNKLDEALDELNLQNNENEYSKKEENGSIDGKSIKWEGSKGREVIYSTKINISDEFKKKGLKTSLKLRFTVFNNGLIAKVDVLESTGYTKLDQEIINQFKKWRFQEAKGEPDIFGIIEIDIGY